MLKNYIKISVRNILKYKGYSFISILGLAVGIACFLILSLWVNDELSYDSFHQKADNIYRVVLIDKSTDVPSKYAVAAAPISKALTEEFPEVKSFTRFIIPPGREALIEIKDRDAKYYQGSIAWADENVFDVFSFNLLKGNPNNLLDNPGQVVLTQSMAEKYFGDENPVGKSISLTMRFLQSSGKYEYLITGVMEDVPFNSHLKFNMICSISSLNEVMPGQIDNWNMHAYYSYLLMDNSSEINNVRERLNGFMENHYDPADASSIALELQPIKEIHLTNDIFFEPSSSGNIIYIYILSIVGFAILLIATVNYMNLATARSANRAKEVGIKKVMGAVKKDLSKQFLSESIVLSLIALAAAVLIVEGILPYFNEISGKQIEIGYFENFYTLPFLLITAVLTGLISGSYPAVYLSSLKPAAVLEGKLSSASRNVILRKLLIVCQFSISIIMFSGTMVVYDQLNYLKNAELGFVKDQVMLVPISADEDNFDPGILKKEFNNSPGIIEAGLSSETPGDIFPRYSIRGDGRSEEEVVSMVTVSIDENYLSAMDIKLSAGRNFSEKFPSDSGDFIINEAALSALGFESAASSIGKTIEAPELNKSGKVIGVVKNFNFTSLHRSIEPLIFHSDPSYFSFYSIRLSPGNISETINMITDKWKEYVPSRPLRYSFLDEKFDKLYQAETRLGYIFVAFSVLTLFVGTLGLFGLVSFLAEQKKKEIGIRKVLGATSNSVSLLLSKEFLKLLLVSSVVALPLSYLILDNWLNNFAYRINVEIISLLISAAFTIVVALSSVIYQSYKAARQNPASILRDN